MENRITVKEASEVLGVTARRVHALIQAGRLPAERFGNVVAIRKSDLALVADRKPGRPPSTEKKPVPKRITRKTKAGRK